MIPVHLSLEEQIILTKSRILLFNEIITIGTFAVGGADDHKIHVGICYNDRIISTNSLAKVQRDA